MTAWVVTGPDLGIESVHAEFVEFGQNGTLIFTNQDDRLVLVYAAGAWSTVSPAPKGDDAT